MERLTKKSGEMVWMKKGELCLEPCEVMSDCSAGDIRNLLVRIATYEDTELTPEEIIALKSIKSWADAVEHELEKYMKLEKEKRLLELPCGLGGTVYANFRVQGDYLREKDKPYPCKVVFIGLSDEPYLHIEFKTGRVWQVNFDEIGKTVFPTKEAAEAALKEQEG